MPRPKGCICPDPWAEGNHHLDECPCNKSDFQRQWEEALHNYLYIQETKMRDNEELIDDLKDTLKMIDEQIAQVHVVAARMPDTKPSQAMDANGGFLMTPLLQARAQVLSAMATRASFVDVPITIMPKPRVPESRFTWQCEQPGCGYKLRSEVLSEFVETRREHEESHGA